MSRGLGDVYKRQVEYGDNFSVYLVLRDNLSILPQDDMILKEKDIVVARCRN